MVTTTSQPRSPELIDVQAILVDGDGDRLQSGPFGDQPVLGPTRLLDGDPLEPAVTKRAAQDREPLRESVAHERVLGLGRGAPRPSEIAHQLVAQLRGAARIARAEGVECRLSQGRSQRPHPARAGKRLEVRDARLEVVAVVRLQRARRNRRALEAERPRHAGRRALRRGQVALGAELSVGLEHDSARDVQLGRERP